MQFLAQDKWETFLPKIPDNCIDLVIIDPPFIVTNKKWDKHETVNQTLVEELFRVMKKTSSLYLWCGIGEKSQSLIRWFPLFSSRFHFKDLITWKKRRGIGARRGWLYTREEILWYVKDNKKFIWNVDEQYSDELRDGGKKFHGVETKSKYKRLTNVWTDIPEQLRKDKRFHYTSKPREALERIIKCHTKEGDVVLDCFGGTGSTGVAAKKLDRSFVICEPDEQFCFCMSEQLLIPFMMSPSKSCVEKYLPTSIVPTC